MSLKKVACDFCDKKMSNTNLKRHQEKCIYKVELGSKKSYVLELLSKNPDLKSQEEAEKEQNEIKISELMKTMQDFYEKCLEIKEKYTQGLAEQTAEEKIQSMGVGENTKYNYLLEWNKFNTWRKKNKRPLIPSSMNQYIHKYECKPSTKVKKKWMLQRLLKVILDSDKELEPIRERFSYSQQYSMKLEEISPYLAEQKAINYEDYLVQKLMIYLALRVGTIPALKLEHFEFYVTKNGSQLALPYTKNKKIIVRQVETEFRNELTSFLNTLNLKRGDFVFLRDKTDISEKRRAHEMSKRINKRIENSKVLIKLPHYKYTSHMFRKCIPNIHYQKRVDEAKEEARQMLGQKRGSSAVEHYLDNNI